MVREFKLPDVGEGVAEGELVSWLVEVGDPVEEDQPVAEVETDKALVELPSPVDGTVRELRAEEGEVVPVGTVIITFDVEGEMDVEANAEESEGDETDADERDAGAVEADAGETSETDAEPAAPGGRVFAAPSARRLARELGVDISTVEGSGPGGRVTDQDVRAAADAADAVDTAAAEEHDEAEEAIAEAEEPIGEDDDAELGTMAADGPTTSAEVPESADRERTLAAPATRRLASELDVDLNAVPATEQRDGEAFVTPEAVEAYAEAQTRAQEADAAALAAREPGDDEPREREEREPYRGVRRTIGEQMERSVYTAPHVTHHDQVDVTALVETRDELQAVAAERGIRLTYMPFVLKAVVAGLEQHPIVNSALDEEAEEIVYRNYYNVGIATATDAGLMVPVLKDVDRKGILQLASELNELVERARDRSIGVEEMRDGTFTITNFGAIGGEYATPIINYPEVAILGLGTIDERPRVHEGEVVPRTTLPLSLSIDHRVVDGADAARFVNTVMQYLEEPMRLLLE